MKAILTLSIFCLSLILFSCAKESKHSGYVDPNEALVEKLDSVGGNSRTYNWDFQILKGIQDSRYYAPVDIPTALNSIPDELKDGIHLPDVSTLLDTIGTEMANIVTFWNTKNKLMFQIQISYFKNDVEYDAGNKDFFIISAATLADNPFLDDPDSEEDPIDKWRTEFNIDGDETAGEVVTYKDLKLNPDLPLFFKVSPSSWTTMYNYYSFDGSKIIHRSTGSKMYYAWYDGVLFQIGYKFDDETIDMESVIRKIILG
ncbi:hypothetical protein [Ancylomarina sp. 16SWW S1-10-2]|uniref:hypothetical protein n=1 Tax=Ancylomarina sp. 16SWW S1-10-2 TaxID=2499681 RepID=UPI0012AD587A|nr:hypothetical protein [Ancylomarina sp. 16SWW S1-10-2]MRT92779.1 hypothetical protein [Ancylomarina sp. 16SWW S1-10-2]